MEFIVFILFLATAGLTVAVLKALSDLKDLEYEVQYQKLLPVIEEFVKLKTISIFRRDGGVLRYVEDGYLLSRTVPLTKVELEVEKMKKLLDSNCKKKCSKKK